MSYMQRTIRLRIKKGIRLASFYLCSICMFILFPMMLLTSFDVFSRAAFNNPISGAVEISSYLMAIFILSGLAYTHQVKGQIFVEILVNKAPHLLKHAINIFTGLLSLFIICLLAWEGWLEAMDDPVVSDMLRIPRWPFKMLLPVASFLLCLEILMDILDSIAELANKDN